MTRFLLSSTFLAGLFAATAAQAALVNYNEFDDGDLSSRVMLDFDMAGTHSVQGFNGSGDEDSFLFSVGAGFVLSEIEIEAFGSSRGVRSASSTFEVNPELGAGPLFAAELDFVSGNLSTVTALSGPLSAGNYRFDDIQSFVAVTEFPSYFGEYFISLTVVESTPAPVPLPASVFPLIAAMGGLYAMRRRSGQKR